VFPYDPNRDDPSWKNFNARYRARYHANVDLFSSLGFDTMNILLDAVCRAGLNRGRIRDALYGLERYRGVTGEMVFDPNAKNIAPLYLGTAKSGKFTFRRYTMDKPYARVGEGGVSYMGPPTGQIQGAKRVVGVFGPRADEAVKTISVAGFEVVGIPSELAWGKSSSQLVDLIYKREAVALIATDRAAAHLAEQIAVKSFLPVIALSSDRKLTSTNIPWIFRLSPQTPLAEALDCLRAAISKAGADRARVREVLASGDLVGKYRFDTTGEPR
jgi:phosphoribosylcarboxyaminoimidazole (NCAIR) mutase